jgi:dihydrofolate reductase
VGKVVANAIMSLDGYVAKEDNSIGRLFDWLQNGEIAIPTPAGDFTVHLTPPSAEHWRRWTSSLGALVCGRTLFEVAEGWQGRHTFDVPVVVVTHQVPTEWVEAHPDAPFTFVTDGVEARATAPSSARCRRRTSCSVTRRSASRATGFSTWCFPCSRDQAAEDPPLLRGIRLSRRPRRVRAAAAGCPGVVLRWFGC